VASALALVAAACADATRPSDAPPRARLLLPDPAAAVQVVPNEYLVVLKRGVTDVRGAADRARALGGTVLAEWSDALHGYWVRIPSQAVAALGNNPQIDWIEPNGVATIAGSQLCPAGYAGCNWGLDRIDQASSVLNLTYNYPSATASNVRVYVLDTGIRIAHQEFGGRASHGYDYIDNDAVADDCNGHGTHVAGTVGGATYGVAKAVRLVAVRVLNCAGSGSWAQVISGINWVTANAVKPAVASMSLGGSANSTVDAAVANSIASGITYVVAAGNSNGDACNYSPARTAAAITVGATGGSGMPPLPVDSRASYSNYGSCLDLFAPGTNITSSYYTSNSATATMSGTSMATPHVSGAAALYLAQFSSATPSQVTAGLVNKSTTGVVSNAGSGSPNRLLYTAFLNGGSSPTLPPPSTSYTVTAWSTQSTCYQRPGVPHSCFVTGEVRDAAGNLVGGGLALTGYSTSDTSAALYWRNTANGRLEVYDGVGSPQWKPGTLTITAFFTSGGVTYRSNAVTLTLMPAPGTTLPPPSPSYTVRAWSTQSTCYQRPGSPHYCIVTGEVRDANGNLVGNGLALSGYSTSDTTAASYWRSPTDGHLEVYSSWTGPWKPGTLTVTAYFISGGVTYRSNGVTLTLLAAP
jgi:subtilisin family serine protease